MTITSAQQYAKSAKVGDSIIVKFRPGTSFPIILRGTVESVADKGISIRCFDGRRCEIVEYRTVLSCSPVVKSANRGQDPQVVPDRQA